MRAEYESRVRFVKEHFETFEGDALAQVNITLT